MLFHYDILVSLCLSFAKPLFQRSMVRCSYTYINSASYYDLDRRDSSCGASCGLTYKKSNGTSNQGSEFCCFVQFIESLHTNEYIYIFNAEKAPVENSICMSIACSEAFLGESIEKSVCNDCYLSVINHYKISDYYKKSKSDKTSEILQNIPFFNLFGGEDDNRNNFYLICTVSDRPEKFIIASCNPSIKEKLVFISVENTDKNTARITENSNVYSEGIRIEKISRVDNLVYDYVDPLF